jgi:hypothetical protein
MKPSLTASALDLLWIPLGLAGAAVIMNDPQLIDHLWALWSSPTQLTHDFTALFGVAPALMNAAILILMNLMILHVAKVEMSGFVYATLFTVLGFSFIGITPLNSLPLYIGAWIYDRFSELEFTNIIVVVMMGTCLGPVVNHVAGWIDLGLWRFPLALVAGIGCGIYLVPMTKLVYPWHNGFNLYNVGFTAGLMAVLIQVLLTTFGMGSVRVRFLSTVPSLPLIGSVWGIVTVLMGLALWPKEVKVSEIIRLWRHGGKAPSDFWDGHPQGVVLFNMALLGGLGLLITHALGVVINGPILAVIFSLIGFGAFGKHPLNVWAPIVGSALMALLLGQPLTSAATLSVILFTSCLAPITGHFGWTWGILAGAAHLLLVSALGDVHGGLNLYNNGFTGGVVATLWLLSAQLIRKDLKLIKK